MLACRYGHDACVALLLGRGASVSYDYGFHSTSILKAIKWLNNLGLYGGSNLQLVKSSLCGGQRKTELC